MGTQLSLEDIRTVVETTYPAPLASIARRCRVTSKADLGGKHKLLIDLFEAYLKFITIVFLQEARTLVPTVRERLPQKEKTLEFLKHPSTGGWVSLLRALCETDFSDVTSTWMKPIAAWYQQPRAPESLAVFTLLSGIADLPFEKKSSNPNAEILNALVTYRNKHLAHAATFTDETLKQRLPLLEGAVAYLLNSAPFLSNLNLFYSERIEISDNEEWLVHGQRLESLTSEPLDVVCLNKPERSELYIIGNTDEKTTSQPISLSPFLLWQINPERKIREIFFYNDAWRTKLDYLSYESGSHHYHQELHSSFGGLIQLKITPGVLEDSHALLSAEERSEHAERLFKQALMNLEAGRDEEALETLEHSITYERRVATYLLMAKTQIKVGDPPAAAIQTLECALDLEPSNPEVLALRAGIEARVEPDSGNPDEESSDTNSVESLSAFKAMVPKGLRRYYLVVWIAMIVAWYSFSGVVEGLFSNGSEVLVVKTLQAMICLALVLGLAQGQKRLHGLRLPLSFQLYSMRMENFNKEFQTQTLNIFGMFVQSEENIDWRGTIQVERFYYLAFAAWMVVLSIAGFALSGSYNASAGLWPFRLLDYGLIYFLVWPVIRYCIMSTVFVFRVSKLSLKPTLTSLTDDGVRSLGPFICFNAIIACLILCLYWLLASLVVHTPYKVDIFFLGVCFCLMMVWSVGMPMMVRRAMKESKSRSIHLYSEHIEKAFKAFLEHPGENELNRYEWLLNHQDSIARISTWPLSLLQTVVGVVLFNVVLFAVSFWYLGIRFGWWKHFI